MDHQSNTNQNMEGREILHFKESTSDVFDEMADYITIRMIAKNMPKRVALKVLVHPDMDIDSGKKRFDEFKKYLEQTIPYLLMGEPPYNSENESVLIIDWRGESIE